MTAFVFELVLKQCTEVTFTNPSVYYFYVLKKYNVNYAGRAVINAAENGASFPLKRRDIMLDYILTLMGRDDNNEGFADSNLELLHTQVSSLLLSCCLSCYLYML